MEYVYAAMLVHKAGKKVDEETVTKVLQSAGVNVDSARVKALVAALDGVNIDEAIKKSVLSASPVATTSTDKKEDAPKKAEKKEEKKSTEQAAAGLGALFG